MTELTACVDCGRRWTAKGEAHCAGCCRHFSSDSAFELHVKKPPEYGPRPFETCRDPATVRTRKGEPKLVLTESRWGPLWSRPGSRTPGVLERFSAASASAPPETGGTSALGRQGRRSGEIPPLQGGAI